MKLLVGTNNGVCLLEQQDRVWHKVGCGLASTAVTAVSAQKGTWLAGTTDGILRSEDMGETWQEGNSGLTERHIRWLACHPDREGLAFAGSEPAAIFVSQDGGATWAARPEVADLRDANRWYLPYSPEAGCVRGFAGGGERFYAAVEVGGMLRTDDLGASWELVPGSSGKPSSAHAAAYIHPDVHSVEVGPQTTEHIYAPTGGGLYVSQDGGANWAKLYNCYCRAIWIDPEQPEHLIFGPADGVDRGGRIEESLDGGETWRPVMAGLPEKWPRHMVERFVQAGDTLLAALSNGELVEAALSDLNWRPILPPSPRVNAAAVVSG